MGHNESSDAISELGISAVDASRRLHYVYAGRNLRIYISVTYIAKTEDDTQQKDVTKKRVLKLILSEDRWSATMKLRTRLYRDRTSAANANVSKG